MNSKNKRLGGIYKTEECNKRTLRYKISYYYFYCSVINLLIIKTKKKAMIQSNLKNELKARNFKHQIKKAIANGVCVFVGMSLSLAMFTWFWAGFFEEDQRQLCEGMKAGGGDYTSHEIVECKLVGVNL